MDLTDERRKLSELTEIALVKNDIESLKKFKKIVDQKKLISTLIILANSFIQWYHRKFFKKYQKNNFCYLIYNLKW